LVVQGFTSLAIQLDTESHKIAIVPGIICDTTRKGQCHAQRYAHACLNLVSTRIAVLDEALTTMKGLVDATVSGIGKADSKTMAKLFRLGYWWLGTTYEY
jgi:hypothetical protein